ncbi:MAG: putative aspartate aminotransferase [Firmicutes bacterium]|nr:putative aspartate aminotransferase [Bacillota bacterium]
MGENGWDGGVQLAGSTTTFRAPGNRLSAVARSIKPSGIRKFFDLVSQREGVISLGIGEPDLEVPVAVRQAGVTAMVTGNTRYTSNAGLLELRHAIAAYLYEHVNVTYNADEVLVTAGVAQGVDLALRTVVSAGDEVLIPEPCFVSYGPCVELAGGRPVPVPLIEGNGFVLTPEALAAAVTPRTRVLLLSYPNNPTGAILGLAELELLLPVILKYDLTIISDEVYSELTYTGSHCSIAALPGMRERTILLNGFSKTFSMTGWRLGFAAGPEALIEGMTRIHQHAMMCAPTVAQLAAVHALRQVNEIAERARAVFGSRRKLLYQGLSGLGLACVQPQGAFYAFPAVDRMGLTCEEFSELLLQEENVAVVPGSAFGAAGEGYVRCSYATGEEQLLQALDRIGRFVNRHRFI